MCREHMSQDEKPNKLYKVIDNNILKFKYLFAVERDQDL